MRHHRHFNHIHNGRLSPHKNRHVILLAVVTELVAFLCVEQPHLNSEKRHITEHLAIPRIGHSQVVWHKYEILLGKFRIQESPAQSHTILHTYHGIVIDRLLLFEVVIVYNLIRQAFDRDAVQEQRIKVGSLSQSSEAGKDSKYY